VRLFRVDNWLRTPADRDVIAHWTATGGNNNEGDPASRHRLLIPEPPENTDADGWEFLALGDTGDAEAAGPGLSPQDAVAQQMARDAALADDGPGRARMVVHTGDVIYMTGERRLYERNFRRPYAPFLTPGSTADDFTFRVPFLPIPGNHDYYDLGGWARWIARIPLLAPGLRALAHRVFSFSLPQGGSDMGRAYMEAFVDRDRLNGNGDVTVPLAYEPGARTRIPNRYYQFTTGGVDFFALDSNTLDAPPPGTDIGAVRQAAAERVKILEAKSDELDRTLTREQRAREQQRQAQREEAARDPNRRTILLERVASVATVLAGLRNALKAAAAEAAGPEAARAVEVVTRAERRWEEGAADLSGGEGIQTTTGSIAHALDVLDEASDEGCAALVAVEAALAQLPEGPLRAQVLGARDETERAQSAWADLVSPSPEATEDKMRKLSEDLLDVQRELALERRRLRYRPEDYDHVQFAWLDAALTAARTDRPGNWRIVYLHHPLYTTIANHCERPDVTDLRDNLVALLQKNDVHLVLSGHSHAFEWFRSDLLPHTGIVVSGGGGQIALRPSLLTPRLLPRRREQYARLRENGVRECAMAGNGPAAPADNQNGLLYHYLRVFVTPDTLTIRPVGVRRLETGGFRREEPMPVFHASRLPEDRPPWTPRVLESLIVRRGAAPEARWV